MTLASMIRTDETALICDLAETYHIHDYRSLPVKLIAALSAGLRENSRIKMKINNEPVDRYVFFLAVIADRIAALTTKDAPSLVDILLNQGREKSQKTVMAFSSGAEFDRAWKE